MSERPLHLRIGTSAWSCDDWRGSVYPAGAQRGDYLGGYARQYQTVEIDSTYYGIPVAARVRKWREVTPPGFIFTAKFPQTITHEKALADCHAEVAEFVGAMDVLEDKLGPLLIQLLWYSRQAFSSADDFLQRLKPFLKCLPGDHEYALEIRNKHWLDAPLLDTLREHKVALALTDQSWMPTISQIMNRFDPVHCDPLTGEFVYIRWLGDRKGIEAQTQNWNQLIVDRTAEMETWVNYIQNFVTRRGRVYGYFNNHYAGFAPGSIELFWKVWEKKMVDAALVDV